MIGRPMIDGNTCDGKSSPARPHLTNWRVVEVVGGGGRRWCAGRQMRWSGGCGEHAGEVRRVHGVLTSVCVVCSAGRAEYEGRRTEQVIRLRCMRFGRIARDEGRIGWIEIS